MRKEDIITLLSEWNFWNKTLDVGASRKAYLKNALKFLGAKANKVLVVVGMRRSGKSFLTKQIVNEFIKSGVDPKNTLIVNFEEARFDEKLNLNLLLKIYDAYRVIIKPKGKLLIVLDEIQEIPRWEKFVRNLQERNEARIVVTGSSSKLMSDELATLLTGRTLKVNMFPLDFHEFLKFRNFNFKEYSDLVVRKVEVLEILREYLKFGGLPEVVIEIDNEVKISTLKRYYEDIISKDVVRRYNIRNIRKIEVIANYYMSNSSSLITFNRTARFLHLPVKTVEMYSKYLETSKLLFFVSRFSFSIKERENSPRKIYISDTGLIYATFKFMENFGKIYENIVAIELLRREKEIYYWKDQQNKEVDFVIKEGLIVKQLIQVCYDIENPETKEREVRALIKASKELKCENLLIITEDFEYKEEMNGKEIIYVSLWKWLLDLEVNFKI